MSEQIRENKMGVMPVGKLLLTMSVPMMISMLVQALYNVVDSFFVAKLSQDALNAVSLAFPIQNIIIGVANEDFENAIRAIYDIFVIAQL